MNDLLWSLLTPGTVLLGTLLGYWRGRTRQARVERHFGRWKQEVMLDVEDYIDSCMNKATCEQRVASTLSRCPQEFTPAVVDALRIGHAIEDHVRFEAKARGLYPKDFDLHRERTPVSRHPWGTVRDPVKEESDALVSGLAVDQEDHEHLRRATEAHLERLEDREQRTSRPSGVAEWKGRKLVPVPNRPKR